MPTLSDEEILSRCTDALPEMCAEIWDYEARLRVRSSTGRQWYDGPLDHLRSPDTIDTVIREIRRAAERPDP